MVRCDVVRSDAAAEGLMSALCAVFDTVCCAPSEGSQ